MMGGLFLVLYLDLTTAAAALLKAVDKEIFNILQVTNLTVKLTQTFPKKIPLPAAQIVWRMTFIYVPP